MGEKKIALNDWRNCNRLLSVKEVGQITGYSYQTILELVRTGVIIRAINKRPYKFDPAHIAEVFFNPSKNAVQPSAQSSLKIRESEIVSHKPFEKGDLWK